MIAGDLDGDAPTGRGRWRQPASLKGRMALLLGLVLIPPLLYSVYQTGSAYLAEAHEQERKAASLLDIVVAYQREVLDGTRNLLDTLVRDSSLQNDEASCNAALAAVAKQNPIYLSLAILDATGEIRCSSRPESVGVSLADRAYFRELAGGRDFVVSERLISRFNQRETIVVAEAVRNGVGGALESVVAVGLDLAVFTRAMRGIDLPDGTAVHIFDAEGMIVGGELADAGEKPDLAPAMADLRALATSPREVVELTSRDGVERLFVSAPVAEGALFAVVGFAAPPRWDWLDSKLLIGILSPTVMLALAVLAIWIASDYLVNRHIRKLVAATRAYGRGHGPIMPDTKGAPEELKELAGSFAEMAARIEHREQELRSSLEQKDLMLREIHHRVKNNLQIVTSLLRLRARSAASIEARRVMDEAQVRIRALALVHRHLYEQPAAESLRVDTFVEDLLDFLAALGTGDDRGIAFRTNLAPVEIASDQAIALALFVTEAVGNAQLHGFPGAHHAPEVRIDFTVEGDCATLVVADNGVGAGQGREDRAQALEGMGLRLMRMLAGQLGGECVIEHQAGTTVRLTFPLHDFDVFESSSEGTFEPADG
ncbi:MAG: histidine kinase dimerization/phosphoacceptor domain -containing protein [Geminicoccaceae bacterium]